MMVFDIKTALELYVLDIHFSNLRSTFLILNEALALSIYICSLMFTVRVTLHFRNVLK